MLDDLIDALDEDLDEDLDSHTPSSLTSSGQASSEGRTQGEELAPIDANPDSLLDAETLKALTSKPESLPTAFLGHVAGNITTPGAVVDFATTVCMAVADGKLRVSQSAELRKWAELMYSCIITGQGGENTQINYIGQLVQLAGANEESTLEVIDVQDSINRPDQAASYLKKAQGE